jgi:integrase
MRSLFTERALKQLLATAPTTELSIPDPTLPRFGLRLKPARGPGAFAATWVIRYTFNGQKRRVSVGDARAMSYQGDGDNPGARDLAAAMLARVDSGIDVATERAEARGRLTLAQAWDQYLASPKFESCTAGSQVAMRNHGRLHIVPELGALALTEVSPKDARAMVAKVTVVKKVKNKKGRLVSRGGAGAARKAFRTLSAFMGWCADTAGLIEANPLYRAVKLRAEGQRQQCWTPEEYKAFFAACEQLEGNGKGKVRRVVADAIRLLVLTGMRRSEVLNLTWSQVRLKDGKIILGAKLHKAGHKTGRQRVIDLVPLAVDLLERQPKHEGVERVFPGNGGAKLALNREFNRARDAAGLPADYVPHGLRHSLATHAALQKATVPELMQLLGHSSPQMALRYVKMAQEFGGGVAGKAVNSALGIPEASTKDAA